MSLTSGTKLGNYEIVEPLGAGGMGEVYRARDPRLNRDVAIKVLPDAFASDPERLARFQREAQMLAALNHSNIAGIYGLEESAGMRFLVLEMVPGETLAELLAVRGPMPVREVLGVARQLAEALEAAHEKGIIHRDLKPANIKLTPEGKVKVLDFGLAKAFATDAPGGEMMNSPTLSMAATRAGVLLGTAAYMSPEQMRGKSLDRRTDVWAFGCVVYELLTGAQAFAGDTVSDAVALILTRDPDWAKLPQSTPQRLRELLRRCVQKDPGHRLRDMGDAHIEIEEVLAENASGIRLATAIPDASRVRVWQRPIALWHAAIIAGALATATLLAWASLSKPSPAPTALVRTSIALPKKEVFSAHLQTAVAISPDGRRIAFVSEEAGVAQLYVRLLDQQNAAPVPESRGAASPLFSPDGNWIAFIAEGKLKKISVQAGGAMTLCDVMTSDMRGASWSEDGWIYIAASPTGGISRVSQGGGKLEAVTILDEKSGERTHRWPFVLPGSKALLYIIGSLKAPDYYFDAQIAVRSLSSGRTKILVSGGTDPRYVASGHLVYSTASGLVAVPFDVQRLEITGPPIALPDQISGRTDTGAMHYAISNTGILTYVEGEPPTAPRSLIWMDRAGKMEVLPAPAKNFYEPTLSPDGKRVAVTIPGARNDDVWIYDIERNSLSRFTYGSGAAGSPLWTPDGKRIVYSMEKDAKPGLFWKAADGSGEEERLVTTSAYAVPCSFTSDGKTLVYANVVPLRQSDIYSISLEGDRKPQVVVSTEFNEHMCAVSPDGKWLAYVSNETGREELYVRGFSGTGGKWQLSTPNYGAEPQWSNTGRELYFRAGNGVGKVDVAPGATFSASPGSTIIPMTFGGYRPGVRVLFSVTPDGKRVLAVQATERDQGTDRINLVLGWGDELARLVATSHK